MMRCQCCGCESVMVVLCSECGSHGCPACFVNGVCNDCLVAVNRDRFVDEYEMEKAATGRSN